MNQPAKSKLQHALALIDAGFYVFPLMEGKKTPPKGMHFKDMASRDKAKAQEWFADGRANIAIYTGRFGDVRQDGGYDALIVVDIDERPDKPGRSGKSGFQTRDQLAADGFVLPTTMRVRTPSGGEHWYYFAREAVKQRDLGRGINIRSQGGYVVAPGSIVDGKTYEQL